ncbi:sperm flagellar protein 1-like [Macrosteles quadrilineatus]|uniref:sperm flagellar protein 1-like n=1 Tax=Macrosteles quadrilineatus TaxID=74068 RepID=UPI0023E14712|nr:sperm flagellar protein 1-like [Macrosteles quadrilineatus]
METFVEIEKLYSWIEGIPLSKPKKNLSRDFADGVLMAEVCKHFFPKIVDLHNYPVANSHTGKVANWETLNMKVFKKLQMKVTSDLIHQIAAGVPGALESVLLAVKQKAENKTQSNGNTGRWVKSASGEPAPKLTANTEIMKEIKQLKSDIHLLNNTVAVLLEKIHRLENLLEIKDEYLKELTADVYELKARKYNSIESFCSVSA